MGIAKRNDECFCCQVFTLQRCPELDPSHEEHVSERASAVWGAGCVQGSLCSHG